VTIVFVRQHIGELVIITGFWDATCCFWCRTVLVVRAVSKTCWSQATVQECHKFWGWN